MPKNTPGTTQPLRGWNIALQPFGAGLSISGTLRAERRTISEGIRSYHEGPVGLEVTTVSGNTYRLVGGGRAKTAKARQILQSGTPSQSARRSVATAARRRNDGLNLRRA